MSTTRILAITASTRPGRLGPAVTDWFRRATRDAAAGVTVETADLATIGLPLLDEPEHPSSGRYVHEHTRAWSRTVAAADAFVVVTPEYNYGMPASLKNAIDYLYDEWAWKPVAFVSYGNTSAGTRGVQMSKQVATTVRLVPIGATVALRIADSVDPDGAVAPGPGYDESARGLLAELVRVAGALRPLREPAGTEGAPLPDLVLSPAGPADLAELLVLQRACWVEEALANDSLEIAALRESAADLAAALDGWRGWVVRRQGRLVAAVRARAEAGSWDIGRLMVAPDLAGHGVGRWLLDFVERQAPADSTRYALFTGARSTRNIRLYERAGYRLTPPPEGADPLAVHLTKPAHTAVPA
jgi:NAD(P)H-dependent FMN reductase/GNAT superfamily N-acetyltransferase